MQQFERARTAMEKDLGVRPLQARAALDRVMAGGRDDLAWGIAGLDASIRRPDRQIAPFCTAFAASAGDGKRAGAAKSDASLP
jgi:hypothetical protein